MQLDDVIIDIAFDLTSKSKVVECALDRLESKLTSTLSQPPGGLAGGLGLGLGGKKGVAGMGPKDLALASTTASTDEGIGEGRPASAAAVAPAASSPPAGIILEDGMPLGEGGGSDEEDILALVARHQYRHPRPKNPRR